VWFDSLTSRRPPFPLTLACPIPLPAQQSVRFNFAIRPLRFPPLNPPKWRAPLFVWAARNLYAISSRLTPARVRPPPYEPFPYESGSSFLRRGWANRPFFLPPPEYASSCLFFCRSCIYSSHTLNRSRAFLPYLLPIQPPPSWRPSSTIDGASPVEGLRRCFFVC